MHPRTDRSPSGAARGVIVLLVAILVVAGGAGGVWYWQLRKHPPVEYQTVTVTRGDLTQVVTATGQLNPVVNVQVGSQISGTIEKLLVDYNEPVQAGQVVAQIEPSTYQANVRQAEGDLASARAVLELARVNARRSQELADQKLIAPSDADKAIADLHQAEAQVQIKTASLQRSQTDLNRCTIYAPIDGIVISRNVDVGQTVAASLSAPTLFVIANDLAKMQIDANVAEADVGGVALGQEVEFTVDAYPQQSFHGRVKQVRNSPLTVQNVVTYDTVIEVANPELKLKPGMTANVSIIIAQRDNVLTIPNAALRFRPAAATTNSAPRAASGGLRPGAGPGAGPGRGGGELRGERRSQRTVYVLRDGKPMPVTVKTGINDGISTEITEGLTEDALVITGTVVKSARPAAAATNPFGGGLRRF